MSLSRPLHGVTENVTMRQADEMIKGLRSEGLKRLFETGDHRGAPAHLALRIRRNLYYLDAAVKVEDRNLPGLYLYQMNGNHRGIGP